MRAAQRAEVLPPSLPPVGISREQAAALIGISTTLFDKCVAAGKIPPPRVIFGRLVYDRDEVIEAFRAMPRKHEEASVLDAATSEGNPWD